MAAHSGKSLLMAAVAMRAPCPSHGIGRCMQKPMAASRILLMTTHMNQFPRNCSGATLSEASSVIFHIWSDGRNRYTARSNLGTASCNLLQPRGLGPQTLIRTMAGHSKWQNIRHIKAAKDAMKARIASKIVQKIRIAVKVGGGTDPKLNSALARVLQEGQRFDVPSTTMEQYLKKVEKEKETGSLVMVEARGPGNCFLMIATFTDRVAHTRSQIQHIMKKHAGSIGNSGIASHAFELKGVVHVPTESSLGDLEKATEVAIEAGAEEVDITTDTQGESVYRFLCDAKEVHAVKQHLENQGLPVSHANQDFIAQVFATLTSQQMELASGLLDALEEMPDVSRVFDNVDPESGSSADSKTSQQ